ncbi:MAG: ribosome maturation factor RimM [Steroidobacterales bacterium]
MSDDAPLIEIGCVGAPFGVRGWIRVRSYTDPPERIFEHRNPQIRLNGRVQSYALESTGRSGGQLTAKLKGVTDRDQAQALRGAAICVPRSELPQRDARDFYRADLVGCEVVDLTGKRLGVVRHFLETPAQVLMVVRGEKEFWVPAVPRHLRRVDLQARRITVDWSDAAV